MNRKITQEKGITLIALVITIIIMLILAAVTINIVINGGLIGYAGNAREAQAREQAKELEEIQKAEYEMAKLTGGTEANTYDEYLLEQTYGVHIGDTINYNFLKSGQETSEPSVTVNTEETGYYTETTHNDETGEDEPVNYNQTFTLPTENNLTWKVIGIENGHILISPTTVTDEDLVLKGKNGVTNGVNILNKISALYGHGDYAEETMYAYGNETSGARSITVEDINNLVKSKVPNFDPTSDTPGYGTKSKYRKVVNTNPQEGDIRENRIEYYDETEEEWKEIRDVFIQNFEYYKNGNWGELTVGGNPVELELTKYSYMLYSDVYGNGIIDNQTTDFKNLVTATDSALWLASTYTYCEDGSADFGLRSVDINRVGSFVYSHALYDSYGQAVDYGVGVRPVVALKSNIQLTETTLGSGVWNITGTN